MAEIKTSAVVLASVILAAVLVAGCSSSPPKDISEEEAKRAAEQFVKEHVKFFSRNGSSTIDLPEYQFRSVLRREEKEKGFFTILMHVTAALGNATKENDMVLKVDGKSGKVVEFNGKRLPE